MHSKKDFFQTLIQNSSDVITILSIDETILYESPSINRILGYDQNELIGRNFCEMIHADDLQRVRNAFAEVVRQRDLTLSADFHFLHKDGSWRVLSAMGSNQLDNPLISGIVLNSRDVTERKQIEENLRQSEERFRRIFDDSPLGIIIVSSSYNILKANKAFCEMLGYTSEELVGRSMRELTHLEDINKSEEAVQKALKGKIPLYNLEKRYVKKNQESLWVELTTTMIHDQEGKVAYILGMVKDISERKVAERDREELISQLQESLAKIKTLRGLIPICAWCKKIRDDEGYWTRVESYIREHADVSFTHCICPTCLNKEDPAAYKEIFGDKIKAQASKSKIDHRNSERMKLTKPINCTIKVDSGESGKMVINAILEEIGDLGMCVRTGHPLEVDSVIYSSSGADDTMGVVRWRKTAATDVGGYRVGIQFVHN
jgi:PAS domain S-box-containing protein